MYIHWSYYVPMFHTSSEGRGTLESPPTDRPKKQQQRPVACPKKRRGLRVWVWVVFVCFVVWIKSNPSSCTDVYVEFYVRWDEIWIEIRGEGNDNKKPKKNSLLVDSQTTLSFLQHFPSQTPSPKRQRTDKKSKWRTIQRKHPPKKWKNPKLSIPKTTPEMTRRP